MLEYKIVSDWEKENNKEYPLWASVWVYDPYGESWNSEKWIDYKGYFEKRRAEGSTKEDNEAFWDYQYEPMVCLPTDEFPKLGNGVGLKYDKDKNKED